MTTRERQIEVLRNAYDKWWGSDDVFGLMLDSLDRLAAADGVSPPPPQDATKVCPNCRGSHSPTWVAVPCGMCGGSGRVAASGPLPAPPREDAMTDALRYISAPTVGFPGVAIDNPDIYEFVSYSASESNVRDALNTCIRMARATLASGPLPERGPRPAEAKFTIDEESLAYMLECAVEGGLPMPGSWVETLVAAVRSERERGDVAEQLAEALRPLAEYPVMESMRGRDAWICRADAPNGGAQGISVEAVFVARAALAAFSAPRTERDE